MQTLFDYLEGISSLKDFLEDFPSVSREAAVAMSKWRRSVSSLMRLLLDESGYSSASCRRRASFFPMPPIKR